VTEVGLLLKHFFGLLLKLDDVIKAHRKASPVLYGHRALRGNVLSGSLFPHEGKRKINSHSLSAPPQEG
jgi:hypothetical protein